MYTTRRKEILDKYRLSPKGKVTEAKYKTSPKGVAARAKANIRQEEATKLIWRILYRLKTMLGCCQCGYAKCSAALSFHHCRGIKKFGVTSGRPHSWLSILGELDKCDVLCSNCHMELHHLKGRS